MTDPEWRLRLTNGVATAYDDAIGIAKPPGAFLRGQVARFAAGGPVERVRATGAIAVYVLAPVAVLVLAMMTADDWDGWYSLVNVVPVVLSFGQLYDQAVHERRIPLSAVSEVAVDAEERTLTVVHERGAGRRLPALLAGNYERTLSLHPDEDPDRVRETLELRGIDPSTGDELDRPPVTETARGYRVVGGVCFCADCASQVSPNDRTCPACERSLRSERGGVA